MKILEARDGFVKFEIEERLPLSSFIKILSNNNNYIAQIVQIKKGGERFVYYAKILFVDYDGILQEYDKTLPSQDSDIKLYPLEKVLKTKVLTPIIIGEFIQDSSKIVIDKSWFNKETLLCIDNNETKNKIISNLQNQFANQGKSLVIDLVGNLEQEKKIAGKDFKLPLNTESLAFIYDDCLNDATLDSKIMIRDIFKDLAEYSKTVKFMPFLVLKNIIDDMVDKSHQFKLIVLKNKLARFDKLGYFATNEDEVQNLENLLQEKNIVLDLSKLDLVFQNRYLETIYNLLDKNNISTQVILNASNNLSKQNLKKVMVDSSIQSLFVVDSRFKFLKEIKQFFKNFVLEPSFTTNEMFKTYGTFLNTMPKDTYLLVGESTEFIPLVSNVDYELVQLSTETQKLSNEEESFAEITEDLGSAAEEEWVVTPEVIEINKKSEELIDKVSENLADSEGLGNVQIFEEDKDEENLQSIELSEESNLIAEIESLPYADMETEESIEEELVIEATVEDVLAENEQVLDNENSTVYSENENNLEEVMEVEPIDSLISEELVLEEVSEIERLEESNDSSDIAEEQIVEIPEDISELVSDETEEEILEVVDEVVEEQSSGRIEESFEDFRTEVHEVIPINDNNDDIEFEEISELQLDDLSELDDVEIMVDINENIEELDILDKEIVEDVDKVFTTMKEDVISDADLDFIDELNSDTLESYEEYSTEGSIEALDTGFQDEVDMELLEPIEDVSLQEFEEESVEILETRNAPSTVVPVYDADIPVEDMVKSDDIEQGDSVYHAKHGHGVVEKMVKYGTKNLFLINFDGTGRKLLDPTLTEIKKS